MLLPIFHLLYNSAFVFAASLILCTAKCIQPFTETVLAFIMHSQFSHRTTKFKEYREIHLCSI